MNKKILLLAAFSLAMLAAYAQDDAELKWVRGYSGNVSLDGIPKGDRLHGLYMDSAGNMYIYGWTNSRGDIQGHPLLKVDSLPFRDEDGLFLAKIDTAGTLLWSKDVRVYSPLGDSHDPEWTAQMVVRNNKIYLFGIRQLLYAHLYHGNRFQENIYIRFFDSVYSELADNTYTHFGQNYPYRAGFSSPDSSDACMNRAYWHFFAVMDMEGNELDRHTFFVYDDWWPLYPGNNSRGRGLLKYTRFTVDMEGNVYLFGSTTYWITPLCWDTPRPLPFMTSAEDSAMTPVPIFPEGANAPTDIFMLKFDTSWNVVARKTVGQDFPNHTGSCADQRIFVIFTGADVDGENNVYVTGLFQDKNYTPKYAETDFPLYYWFDSTHALKAEGRHSLLNGIPFAAKYDSLGNLIWLNQMMYTDWSADTSNWDCLEVPSCTINDTSLFTAFYTIPQYGQGNNYHQYYYDSTHLDTMPYQWPEGASRFHETTIIMEIDLATGQTIGHFLPDTMPAMTPSRNPVTYIPWNNSIITAKENRRPAEGATDLVRLNLEDHTVTTHQRIWGTGDYSYCHPHGWMMRGGGETGNLLAAPDGRMFPGTDIPNSDAGTITIAMYYDSTQDLRRRHFDTARCPAPTSLTALRTARDEASVAWNGAPEHTGGWVVSHGPEGTVPGEGAKDTVEDASSLLLTGLDGSTRYAVYVKAHCDRDIPPMPNYKWKYASAWVGPVVVDTIADTSHTAITLVDANPESLFTLTPNPTTGEVQVIVKSEKLKDKSCTVTVLDASGHEVLRTTLNSQLLTLNLQSLPAGTYFVTVTADTKADGDIRVPGVTATQKLILK